MGFFTKDIQSMEDMFLHGLQDIYYAENQITKALPKMIGNASDPGLKSALQSHLQETKGQITRLEQIFASLGKDADGITCPAINGLIEESDDTAGEIEDRRVLDAAIIANGQAVEHYEISRYGTLIAWAETLGHQDVVQLLTANLNEEKAADAKLSGLALRKGINTKAAAA